MHLETLNSEQIISDLIAPVDPEHLLNSANYEAVMFLAAPVDIHSRPPTKNVQYLFVRQKVLMTIDHR